MKRKEANQSPTQAYASWHVLWVLGHHLPLILFSNYAKKNVTIKREGDLRMVENTLAPVTGGKIYRNF